MMAFLLLAPASTKWLGWRKDRTSPRDRLGRFCDIYCAVRLRHSFCVTCYRWHSVEQLFQWKLWTKILTTLVKRRKSYKCVCINSWGVFLTRVHKSFTGNLARYSFSLFEQNTTPNEQDEWTTAELLTSKTMDDYRNSPTVKFCTDLFPAHRCPFAIKFNF